jgi:hypothetical protein
MNETVLRRTLVGMDVSEYYWALNHRVFFFLDEPPLLKLRNAPPYRDRAHEMLVLDTAALLARYGHIVELSPYNSGAVHPGAKVQRGPRPFLPIGEYPRDERRDKRPPIAELTVPGGVQDVSSLLIERRRLQPETGGAIADTGHDPPWFAVDESWLRSSTDRVAAGLTQRLQRPVGNDEGSRRATGAWAPGRRRNAARHTRA